MSTLWTPRGEHRVPTAGETGQAAGAGAPPSASPAVAAADRSPRAAGPEGAFGGDEREPTAEEVRQAQAELDAMRAQLLEAPVEVVIANHAMGMWELAALHLSSQPPQMAQAQLAIDALTALVEGLSGRLGEAERTLEEGLAQVRMAFVQIHRSLQAQPADGGAPAGPVQG